MIKPSDDLPQPISEAELKAMHDILNSDPQRYLRIVNRWIDANPNNWDAYFSRHFVWIDLGELDRALDDLTRCLVADPNPMTWLCRGDVYRARGQYAQALADYARGEAMDPALWEADAIGPYYQADVHARLGDDAAALACCARLPGDFWTPGLKGAPAGDREAVAEELSRIAARARSGP